MSRLSRTTSGRDDLAGRHIPADNKRPGAVANRLKLTTLHLPRCQRQARVFALQGLHPGQFIRAHHPFACGRQCGRLVVQGADILYFGVKLRVRCRGQPIPDQVGLQSVFFQRRAAWRGEICAPIPRKRISSAISRLVHWLIGRPAPLGASQASATMWQTCAAVLRAG